MPLVRYSPLSELQKIENDFDKLWRGGPSLLSTFSEPATMDMYEEKGKLIAEFTLPNFKKDEINVNTDQGVLEVSAEHKEKNEDKGQRRYYYRESSDQYLRRVTLPDGVNTEKSEAHFKDGVLKITMPYTKPKKAKEIAIK